MVRNKDRWSALSMQQRADLIKLYVAGGILDLNKIREHYNKFGNGGDITNTSIVNDNQNITTGQKEQLINNAIGVIENSENTLQNELLKEYPKNTKKHIENRQLYGNTIKDTYGISGLDDPHKQFTLDWLKERNKNRPDLVSPEQLQETNRLLETLIEVDDTSPLDASVFSVYTPDENLKNYNNTLGRVQKHVRTNKDVLASYSPNVHGIVYKGGKPWHNINDTTPTHEYAHSYSHLFLNSQLTPIMNKYEIPVDEYINNPDEIYSRLMELRKTYKLDPSKKYSIDDVKNMRMINTLTGEKGFNILDNKSFSDEFILDLFNNVASTDTTKNNTHKNINNYDMYNLREQADANMAAYGGKLNKYKDGGYEKLGVPWASLNSSNYDYFNASKDNMPKEKNKHWTSRNNSGRILKSPEHPTIEVALDVEGILGNKIYKNVDGTYSSYTENQFPTSLGTQLNKVVYDISPLDPNKRFKDIKTTKGRKYNEDNMLYISDKLNNTLLKDIQKNAILGSIIEESGGNPFAVDNTGKFKGLLQWEGSRYSPDTSLSEKEEIDKQLLYLIETLHNTDDKKSWTHGGSGSGYKTGKHAKNSFFNTEDLYKATHSLNRGYIRPTGKNNSVKNRYNVAKQIK